MNQPIEVGQRMLFRSTLHSPYTLLGRVTKMAGVIVHVHWTWIRDRDGVAFGMEYTSPLFDHLYFLPIPQNATKDQIDALVSLC